jgi:hypothetical protein
MMAVLACVPSPLLALSHGAIHAHLVANHGDHGTPDHGDATMSQHRDHATSGHELRDHLAQQSGTAVEQSEHAHAHLEIGTASAAVRDNTRALVGTVVGAMSMPTPIAIANALELSPRGAAVWRALSPLARPSPARAPDAARAPPMHTTHLAR